MEWQPIATAPKDEQLLMLWFGRKFPVLGFWQPNEKKWRPAIQLRDLSGFGHMANGANIPATHWMHLPGPPDDTGATASRRAEAPQLRTE